MKTMRASEARKLSEGKDWSNILVTEVLRGVKFATNKGDRYCQMFFTGPYTSSPGMIAKTIKELEKLGYTVESFQNSIVIHW